MTWNETAKWNRKPHPKYWFWLHKIQADLHTQALPSSMKGHKTAISTHEWSTPSLHNLQIDLWTGKARDLANSTLASGLKLLLFLHSLHSRIQEYWFSKLRTYGGLSWIQHGSGWLTTLPLIGPQIAVFWLLHAIDIQSQSQPVQCSSSYYVALYCKWWSLLQSCVVRINI